MVKVPAREEHGRVVPAVTRVRRNWAPLIAVPVVAIVLLSGALVTAWPMPSHPSVPYPWATSLTDVGGRGSESEWIIPRVSPEPSAPEVSAPPCVTSLNPMPSYRRPSPASVIALEELGLPPCQTLALGATALIGDAPGGMAQVTALPAVDPDMTSTPPRVPAGRHRVWFRLHVLNLGAAGKKLPYRWVWAAASESGWIASVDLAYEDGWLEPGQNADQIVAFDVAENLRLSRLRLGLAPNTVDWVIG